MGLKKEIARNDKAAQGAREIAANAQRRGDGQGASVWSKVARKHETQASQLRRNRDARKGR